MPSTTFSRPCSSPIPAAIFVTDDANEFALPCAFLSPVSNCALSRPRTARNAPIIALPPAISLFLQHCDARSARAAVPLTGPDIERDALTDSQLVDIGVDCADVEENVRGAAMIITRGEAEATIGKPFPNRAAEGQCAIAAHQCFP